MQIKWIFWELLKYQLVQLWKEQNYNKKDQILNIKARLQDQNFHKKLVQCFLTVNLLKENFVKVIPFTPSQFIQSLIKVYIPSYLSTVNSKTNKTSELDLDSEMSIKIYIKIGWVSILSKFIKVFDAGLHNQRTLSKKTLTKFLMENFDHENTLKTLMCSKQLQNT